MYRQVGARPLALGDTMDSYGPAPPAEYYYVDEQPQEYSYMTEDGVPVIIDPHPIYGPSERYVWAGGPPEPEPVAYYCEQGYMPEMDMPTPQLVPRPLPPVAYCRPQITDPGYAVPREDRYVINKPQCPVEYEAVERIVTRKPIKKKKKKKRCDCSESDESSDSDCDCCDCDSRHRHHRSCRQPEVRFVPMLIQQPAAPAPAPAPVVQPTPAPQPAGLTWFNSGCRAGTGQYEEQQREAIVSDGRHSNGHRRYC